MTTKFLENQIKLDEPIMSDLTNGSSFLSDPTVSGRALKIDPGGNVNIQKSIMAGQTLMVDNWVMLAADGKTYKTDGGSATVADRTIGVARVNNSDNVLALIQIKGVVDSLTALTPGSKYYLQDPSAVQSATTNDTGADVYGINWLAQTFSHTSDFFISSVILRLLKTLSPGTFTVSIRATTAGVPSGADLVSGTIAEATLTGSAADYFIGFSTPLKLTAGVTYAIVMRATGGSAGNTVTVRHASSNSYGSGERYTSGDSGGAWSVVANQDLYFKVNESLGTIGTTPGTYSKQVGIAELSGKSLVITL